jgi:hypothetical protein
MPPVARRQHAPVHHLIRRGRRYQGRQALDQLQRRERPRRRPVRPRTLQVQPDRSVTEHLQPGRHQREPQHVLRQPTDPGPIARPEHHPGVHRVPVAARAQGRERTFAATHVLDPLRPPPRRRRPTRDGSRLEVRQRVVRWSFGP